MAETEERSSRPEVDFSTPIVVPTGDEPLLETDIPFRETAEGSLKLDVYRSRRPGGDDSRPGVLMVYGDTDPELLRSARQWGQYRSWGTLLANQGSVAVVADHRSHEVAGLQGAAEDVAAALEFVIEHETRFGIDPGRIGVFGVSFGVPYQLWAVGHSPRSVRALVCYYGFMDLRGFEDDLRETSEAVTEFAAVKHLEAGRSYPPMLVVQAGKDSEGLNHTIDSFVRESERRGQELELIRLDEAQHAFDVLDDTDLSREAIWRTVAFLQARLA